MEDLREAKEELAGWKEKQEASESRIAELEDSIEQTKATAQAETMELMELSDAERKNTLLELDEKTQALTEAAEKNSELEARLAELNGESLRERLEALTAEMDLLQQKLTEARDAEVRLRL